MCSRRKDYSTAPAYDVKNLKNLINNLIWKVKDDQKSETKEQKSLANKERKVQINEDCTANGFND